jgi:8-oxo-dGTP pyrophosphatase MutT (NUDIX family)
MEADPDAAVHDRLVCVARRFAASGAVPVPARAAATVVLLRPPLEVFLLRRASTMAFAAGMYVFPGGAVDPRDAGTGLPFFGAPPAWWAQRLGVGPEQARAVVCAAAREVFEEAGVLLAAPVGGGDLPASPRWEDDRRAVEQRALGFAELLVREGLQLRADLLRPWGHWVTPEFEPRRYDTWFFVAALPSGQLGRHATGEADEARWVPVRDTDGLAMLPPTRRTLAELAAFPDVPAVLAAAGDRDAATPVLPRFTGETFEY